MNGDEWLIILVDGVGMMVDHGYIIVVSNRQDEWWLMELPSGGKSNVGWEHPALAMDHGGLLRKSSKNDG